MLRSKKTAYVTIGDAAAAPAAPAAEGVDALACEQESAAIYAATEPLKSLVEVRSAGAVRVLVVDAGATGESIVAGCLAAGLVPCVAYTEDMARAARNGRSRRQLSRAFRSRIGRCAGDFAR